MLKVTLIPMDTRDKTYGPFICERFHVNLQNSRKFDYMDANGGGTVWLPEGKYYVADASICDAAGNCEHQWREDRWIKPNCRVCGALQSEVSTPTQENK